MGNKPLLVDWSKPQRQPAAGFVLALLKTAWHMVRVLWPIVAIRLLRTGGGAKSQEPFEIGIAVVLLITLMISFFRMRLFRFFIVNDELQVRKGWLKKEMLSIPLERIQAVHIEEPLLHRALGIVKLRIDTAGSAKSEATIDALRLPMAEALRQALLQERISTDHELAPNEVKKPVVLQLGLRDLMRLSLTANHLEAFIVLLSFSYSLYDNLRPLAAKILPGEETLAMAGFAAIMGLAFAGLIMTFIVSAIRMALRFYNYQATRDDRGFALNFGLINRQQQLIGFEKIQFLRWRASWLRRYFKLWLLELAAVGETEMKRKQKTELPLTHPGQVGPIAESYHRLPTTEKRDPLRIVSVYAQRMLILIGLLPLVLVMPLAWLIVGSHALFLLAWPAFIWLRSALHRRKFRAWPDTDCLLIRDGLLGERFTLLKWYKIQTATLVQSPYQRSHHLATLKLYTAAGRIDLPWLPLEQAERLLNYALYEVEREERVWM
jgi:putative membrane protein